MAVASCLLPIAYFDNKNEILKTNNIKLPKLPLRFFRWYCHPKMLHYIEGDLIEMYEKRLNKSGKRVADLRFVIDVLLLFRRGIVRPTEGYKNLNTYGMYKSYFTIAWRTFLKSKGYSLINIMGLAIGLASCLLIALYVHHELSYDRFNEKADRIYRVNTEIKFGDNHFNLAVVGALFGETAQRELPQVEQTTRLAPYGSFLVKKGNENIREADVAWADSTLFDVFTLPVISGDTKTALTEPNSIVITESVAKKYFESTDVVGNTLTINNTESRKITAVIKDLPQNCHFKFTSFVPMTDNKGANEDNWAGGQNWVTYLLLRPGADVDELVDQLNKMQDRHLEPQLKSIINKSLEEFKSQGDFFKASVTNLTDIHLHSNRVGELNVSGNVQYVYIFSVIASLILGIAIINFMNLATARSANRAREVGMRKVMGSMKSGLIQQFVTESTLTCAIAMLLAVALTAVVLPSFNNLTGQFIDVDILKSWDVIAMMVALAVVVGLLAGSYPAFYLSAFQPVAVLKGNLSGNTKKSFFRNALVVFQFSASVILIAGTLIVFKQMEYIREKNLGYDREQLLVINNIDQLGNRVSSLNEKLLSIAGVEKGTVTGYLPVNFYRTNDSFFSSPSLDLKSAISLQKWTIDQDYLSTMGMQLVEGRNFSNDSKADSLAIILNESAAKFLGANDLIARKLYNAMDMEGKVIKEYHIIGIVKDFHFSSLRDQVNPLAFIFGKDQGGLTVKLNTSNVTEVIATIEQQWKSIAPDLPFEFSFMDDDFDKLYKGEKQTGELISIFASLSILISCLGLFGLATYLAEQRTREIGIRKVLGASVQGLTALLSKDFVKLVLIAIIIATPVAWYFANQWLQGFAYRITVAWWYFAIAGLVAIVIAVLTVSTQAIKAAMTNPVKSLRSE